MLTTPEAPSFPPELQRALDAEGEEEYRQLLRVTRAARGSFFLFLIESDYSPAARNMLLDCLRADLAAEGLRLRRVTLTADELDLFRLPELETPVAPDEAIVLVGIENTPGLLREPGRKPERPPIYALLNRLRETLHTRLPVPFLVWCTPSVYTGLQTHAPDFFDHYAGLFQFLDSNPAPVPNRLPTAASADVRPQSAILSPAAAKSAASFYEQRLAELPEPTLERARALLGLANALLELHGPDYPQHVRRTLYLVEEALALLSPKRNAYEWARGQILKGIAHNELLTGDRTRNLQQAIACYEAALRVATESALPHEWAMAQNNLGNAYRYLRIGDRTQNLQQAIACYEAALRVRAQADLSEEWASTQSNLGATYRDLPTGDRTQNLLCAIEHHKATLRIYTETAFPYEWARTQNSLGNVYRNLSGSEWTENLQQALACYEAALRVHTEADYPQEWADTQYNLGNTYYDLPTGDRTQNLLFALNCYEAALRIRTATDFPHDWANTQFNLALVQKELGNLDAARQAARCAIRGYRQVGLEAEAEQAESLLRELGDGEMGQGGMA